MLDKVEKPLVCFAFVLYDEIVGLIVFEQWCCNRILLVEVLPEKQWRERFVYA